MKGWWGMNRSVIHHRPFQYRSMSLPTVFEPLRGRLSSVGSEGAGQGAGTAIADDIGAVLVIAIFYTADLSVLSLALAGLGILGLVVLNRMRVVRIAPRAAEREDLLMAHDPAVKENVLAAKLFPFRIALMGGPEE